MNFSESFLTSLAETLPSTEKFSIEKESLIEIGCYFYRTTSIISELAENIPDNELEILPSVSTSTKLAKAVLLKLQNNGQKNFNTELKNTVKELQGLINQIGENLSSVTKSAFKNKKHVEIAVNSLSKEMRKAQFQVNPVSEMEPSYQESWQSSIREHFNIDSTPTEEDIYSFSTEVCTEYSNVSDFPHILQSIRNSSQGSHRPLRNSSIRSNASGSRSSRSVETMYRSFICPLTNMIMEDPVTIQSGVTCERKAITEYFESFGDEQVVCPFTGERLENKSLSPNIALRNIIQEWQDRDESSRLRLIRKALSSSSTVDVVLDALNDLKTIWEKCPRKIVKLREVRVIPLVFRLLEFKDRKVRCAAIDMIRLLAKEDQEKELIGETSVISMTIRMLSSSHQPTRHAALLLLIELSSSNLLSEKIGGFTGGTLILIQTKYNRSIDTFASEAADQVLKNMEQCPNNIKCMAGKGYLDPLLNNLIEGAEERKLEMVRYLGEITFDDDNKTYVAKKASRILAEMFHNGDPFTRLSVCKAVAQISSHAASAIILVKSGIIGTIVQEMFTKVFSEQMDSLNNAMEILTNILESGVEFENLMVNSQGETNISVVVVSNMIYMIKSTTPENLKISLTRILYHMAKSSKSAAQILSAIKESELSYNLLEVLNSPRDELVIPAINLLILLLPQMGHLLIKRLCETNGQPEGLLKTTSNYSRYTERQALSASFLAKVPHQDLTLNLSLVRKNTIPGVLQSISNILNSGARNERFANMYLEGLVGIVVRLTTTLYDHNMLNVAMDFNFTSVLTDLLTETSSNEVLRLAASGLEKLSAQSIYFSKPPQIKEKNRWSLLFLPKCLLPESSKKTNEKLCIVHKGVCFKQNTLCLIEANAVEGLLTCVEHRNVEVAEAALSAISTLLDDQVNVKKSVDMLIEMNAIQQVLKAIRQHKIESLWQKAFWMIERFLLVGGQRTISLVKQDRMLNITVVTAFHHGDAFTRQMAEKILTYLNIISRSDTLTM